MTGTFFNVAGIVLGGLLGLTVAKNLSPRTQHRLKMLLVLFTIYAGFSMIWLGLKAPWGRAAGQLGIALLALVLGSALGSLLRLQRSLNCVGQWVRERFTHASEAVQNGAQKGAIQSSEGFLVCTVLFCVAPLSLIGSAQEGLNADWRPLAVKGLLDGLATLGFVATFGWSPLLAAAPVLAFQGLLTLGIQGLLPWVGNETLRDSVGITGGFIVATLSLVILDLRKVPAANYLPALVLAPLLTHWWL